MSQFMISRAEADLTDCGGIRLLDSKYNRELFLSVINWIKTITFYDLHIIASALISDILLIELTDGQNLFIDPGFLGITLGGMEQKEYWKENLQNFDRKKIKKIDIIL